MTELVLSNGNIDLARTQAEEYLGKLGTDRASSLRILFSLEEILLNYQAQLGESQLFSIRCYSRMGQPRIELSVSSDQPLPFEENEETVLLNRLVSQMAVAPTWRYSGHRNIILFTPMKKPRSQQSWILLSLLLSISLGLAFRFFAPELGHSINEKLLVPILDSVTGLLNFISGPVIFLSICWGIYGIGDVSTLNRVGRRMMTHFMVMLLLLGLLALAVEFPFMELTATGSSGRIDLAAISALILDSIPRSFVEPFETNNPMQIIFIAALMGLALLVLGPKGSAVADLVEQGNRITMLIMAWFTHLIPIIIFCCCFGMALDIFPSQLLTVGKLTGIHLFTTILAPLLAFLAVVVRQKANPRVLGKKLLPTFLIGLSTASSTAAFSKNVSQCKKMGIQESLVNFGVPLGQVIYMPTAMILYMDICINMAAMFGIAITPIYLFNTLLISLLLSIAIPPIPGADVAIFALLFTQMGIPSTALALLLPINMLLDFTDTALNLICLQCELIQVAGDSDMLDREKLRKL